MDTSRHRLVVFDLCNTLYATNTTVGFLKYYQETNGNPHIELALRRWTERQSAHFYLGALAHRLLRWDIARDRLVATLVGENRQTLSAAAREFAIHCLPPLANKPLHDRLARHKDAGDRIMIVSNSLDLIVAPIAESLGAEFEASTLGFRGEFCTGLIQHDLTGRKTAAVGRHIGTAGRISFVYTDNRSDLDLVKIADHAAIVIPSDGREEHWGGSRCEYIRL